MRTLLGVIYLRTLLNTLFEGITNNSLQSTGFCFLNKFIIYTFMHKCARTSTTTLALSITQPLSLIKSKLCRILVNCCVNLIKAPD